MEILLTGVTGYIGRRLLERFQDNKDLRLCLFVRNTRKIPSSLSNGRLRIAEGTTFDKASLVKALRGIDTAYYLIHSMGARKDYDQLERTSAENFREACIQTGVKRIIYLGGLGDKNTASKHLLSRIRTGEILSARPDKIQTIWLRAAVIIGSGSASFEIIRHLVQKLPVMTTPKWVRTRTQPIGITSVLDYLERAKDIPLEGDAVVDIGSEAMSFKDMILRAAKVMGLKRRLIPVPFLTPKLSSYWLVFVTPVNYHLAGELVKGLRSETVIQNQNANLLFPEIHPLSYEDAVVSALKEIENEQVLSRWCDSSAEAACDIKEHEDPNQAVYRDEYEASLADASADAVFEAIESVGGKDGWSSYRALLNTRSLIDKFLGGPGHNRGRRHPEELRIGDSLDFWKVVDLKQNKRLLLALQLKSPGKGWLEFTLEENTLRLTAHFLPRGLWGRAYWYLLKPFHGLFFRNIVKKIIRRAQGLRS